MRTNKELKIAAIVGAIMIIICILMISIFSNDYDKADIAVYKNMEINGQRGYVPCTVPETVLKEIYVEFKKTKALDEDDLVDQDRINGDYKIISGEKFIAFDKESNNTVYISEENKLYTFESSIYENVINTCN